MTVIILIVSLLIGMVLAEIAIRAFSGHWFRSQLSEIMGIHQAFRDTDGDDARQALLLRSGRMTLQFSLKLLGLLTGLAAIVGLAPWLLAWSEPQQAVYFVALSVVASGWWFLRPVFISSRLTKSLAKSGNAYSLMERWLHWLALEPAAVRHLAFELERQFSLPKRTRSVASSTKIATDPADGAVYVCGLARSGTTMLLRVLDEVDDFRSLTYRDMPFVMAPNLWKQITRHAAQPSVPEERAHGDGIIVDFDSPEGLEEVFWRTFGSRTKDPHCFGVDEPSLEALAAFADFRALVANPRTQLVSANGIRRRYLSKNNNNLLRLSSLCAEPTATVLLVYRNPIATARSLHRQHQRFCAQQTEDRFTRTYMRWLAHYEFGLDHLPFCFAVPEMDFSLKPEDLDYWLDYWNAVYHHILLQKDLNLYFVNHDELRAEPVGVIKAIFDTLGVKADAIALAKRIAAPDAKCADGFSPELLRRTEATYNELLNNPRNIYLPASMLKR